MAKISSYDVDDQPSANDFLIGSDGDDSSKTKQFRVSDVLGLPDLDQSYAFGVKTGQVETFMLKMLLKYDITVESIVLQADAGMTGVAVKVDGTAIGGMSAISVTTSPVETEPTAETVVSAGSTITLVTSGTDAGATLLQAVLNFKRA